MGIYEGLELQKHRVNELMKQKDVVIEECRKELDAADYRYILDQEKQATDIYCLVERIDKQVNVMKRTYREHLELLQKSIDNERELLRKESVEKWEKLYNHRAQNEEFKQLSEKEQNEFYANEMERIKLEHDEITRSTRIRLEKDNQDLQIELENLKGNVLLNTDKLDYNFQILKRREEENIIIKNQQKRRISKLNETVTHLKKKIDDLQKKSQTEIGKLMDEIQKWRKKLINLEEKSDNMLEINEQKYQNIWKINEDEAKDLLKKILDIDKLLYEQQLGLEWEPPTIELLEKTDLPSYVKATKLLNDSNLNKPSSSSSKKEKKTNEYNINDNKILRTIMKNIADHGGFLLEQKLLDLLKPYAENDQTLVKIDNIFYVNININ